MNGPLRRPLRNLADGVYDILIIGGGVNGLATAWDAALRGLKVALVERGDYGGATSASSLRIIHGGLRYLQHADFGRMREAIQERRNLFRIAPHWIEPIGFLVPTQGWGMKGRVALSVAMTFNDLLSLDRNRGIPDPKNHLSRGHTFSKKKCLELAPYLDADRVNGGAIFYDGRMHNSERVTLGFAQAADELGADLANYCEVTEIIRTGRKIERVRVRDQIGGDEFEARAHVVCNVTGPWSPLIRQLAGSDEPLHLQRNAGMQIITPAVAPRRLGLAVTSKHMDPHAKIRRGGRHYFSVPWRGKTIWGTTDKEYDGHPDDWRIESDDVARFVAELNQAMPGLRLDASEVQHAYGGLRAIEGRGLNRGRQVSRYYEIFDHASDLRLDNLLSLEGVKFTACRIMAEKLVDRAVEKLGKTVEKCLTDQTPLPGGKLDSLKDLVREIGQQFPGWSEARCRHLAKTWGRRWTRIADRIEANVGLADRVGGENPVGEEAARMTCWAEVEHALENESVFHLEDLLFRRTEIGTLGHPGHEVLQALANRMAAQRDWDPATVAKEITRCEEAYPISS